VRDPDFPQVNAVRNKRNVVCDHHRMKPATFTKLAGAILVIVAGWLLFSTVNATTPAGGTVACGNALSPDNADGQEKSRHTAVSNGLTALSGVGQYQPDQYQGYQAACAGALDIRSTWGYVVGGIGVLTVAGGFVVRRPDQAGPSRNRDSSSSD
jgi:hypothetical protein